MDTEQPADDQGTLRIEPAEADLHSTDSKSDRKTFKLFTRLPGGGEVDSPPRHSSSSTPHSWAALTGPVLTASADHADETEVVAQVGALLTSTNVRLHSMRTRVADGAPPDAAQQFAAASEDGTLAPSLSYPCDGSSFPPNLSAFELHFTGAAELLRFVRCKARAWARLPHTRRR